MVVAGETAEAAAAGLCVINTHLFFHPRAPHIRTLHTAALMERAEAMLKSLPAASDSGSRPSILFCGDLNSDLNEGIPGTSFVCEVSHLHTNVLYPCDNVLLYNIEGIPHPLLSTTSQLPICLSKDAKTNNLGYWVGFGSNRPLPGFIQVCSSIIKYQTRHGCKGIGNLQQCHVAIGVSAGTVELLRQGRLPADFWDWREGQDFAFSRRGFEAAAFTAEADAFELMAASGAKAAVCPRTIYHPGTTLALQSFS